jgi:hypothetical protein
VQVENTIKEQNQPSGCVIDVRNGTPNFFTITILLLFKKGYLLSRLLKVMVK